MSAGSGQQINAGNSGKPLDYADKPRKVGVCRPRGLSVYDAGVPTTGLKSTPKQMYTCSLLVLRTPALIKICYDLSGLGRAVYEQMRYAVCVNRY